MLQLKCTLVIFTFLIQIIYISATAPITAEFNNTALIACETTKPTTESDCTSLSDNYVTCCFLSAKLVVPDKLWQKNLCLPIRPQTTPYNYHKLIFGIGFSMKCGNQLNTLPSDIYAVTEEKFTSCGPERPISVLDCNPYSLKDNTCCMGNYLVDYLSIVVNQCYYFGSLYDQGSRDSLREPFNITQKVGKVTLNCVSTNGNILTISSLGIILFFICVLFF